jgi:hypothetical protein
METLPLLGISVWLIAKFFVLFGLAIYIIFSLVVVRQVQLMVDTVEVGFEGPVKLLSYIHLVFAVLVFLFALIIL